MSEPLDTRQLYRQYQQASARFWAQYEAWLARPVDLPPGLRPRAFTAWLHAEYVAEQALLATRPVFPEACMGMPCGAQTRAGRPCRSTILYGGNGRCRYHGGLSTGPRTVEGKRRAARNGLCPKRPKQTSWSG